MGECPFGICLGAGYTRFDEDISGPDQEMEDGGRRGHGVGAGDWWLGTGGVVVISRFTSHVSPELFLMHHGRSARYADCLSGHVIAIGRGQKCSYVCNIFWLSNAAEWVVLRGAFDHLGSKVFDRCSAGF